MIGQVRPETPWERARIGRFTASEIHKLLTPGKRPMTESELSARPKKGAGSKATQVDDYSILSTGALTYIREKAAEITTGTVRIMETFSTDWGKIHEAGAIEALRKHFPGIVHYGTSNQQFFKYSVFSGGSPDAEWNGHTVFEIKCPENPANHEAYMDLVDAAELMENHYDYYCQLQMNMATVAKKNGLQFADMVGVFASFDPRYPDDLQLHTITTQPDFELISAIDAALGPAELELANRMEGRNITAA